MISYSLEIDESIEVFILFKVFSDKRLALLIFMILHSFQVKMVRLRVLLYEVFSGVHLIIFNIYSSHLHQVQGNVLLLSNVFSKDAL